MTSALNSPPVNAPTLQLGPVGSSGPTGLSPRGHAPMHLIAPTPMHRFIRCHWAFSTWPAQCTTLLRRLCVRLSDAHRILRCSLHRFIRCNLTPSTWPGTRAANCSDAHASVYPVPTGYSGALGSDHLVLLKAAELVHFNDSLSSFFVFYFAWPFCFIPVIY